MLDIQQNHIYFTTQFVNLNSFYIFVDSTFKSNREGLELFVLILLFNGEGYPASYFYLDRKFEENERKNAITKWYKSSISFKVSQFKRAEYFADFY